MKPKCLEEDCGVTNGSLRLLDCSPLKKHVRTDRTFNHGKRKIEEFTKKFRRAVAAALTEPELENDDCDILNKTQLLESC